jgi:hypothetical protein
MKPYEREVQRARQILIELIEVSGMSRREVERHLLDEEFFWSTDVTRLLAGKLDLKLRHILAITRLVGLDPGVFFTLLLPEPEPSPLLERIRPMVDAGDRRLRRVAARSTLGGQGQDMDPVRRGVSALIEQLQVFVDETSGRDGPSGGAQKKTEKAHRRPAQALGAG